MKKHYYNSISAFYEDISDYRNNPLYSMVEKRDNPKFTGLSLCEIQKNMFSYPVGVEKISHFKDFTVEKDISVKYWNQFDGYDIDVDRMMDNLDFLIDCHKKRMLPKTMDIYINIGEGSMVNYENLLCKTYATIKIIDKLETLGVRCSVFACTSFKTLTKYSKTSENGYLEICVKQYADSINLGSLCTAISPWMLRHWVFLFIIGKYPDITEGIAYCAPMPSELKGIIIETGSCLNKNAANHFIESIKL